jgi:hypothetical protein
MVEVGLLSAYIGAAQPTHGSDPGPHQSTTQKRFSRLAQRLQNRCEEPRDGWATFVYFHTEEPCDEDDDLSYGQHEVSACRTT